MVQRVRQSLVGGPSVHSKLRAILENAPIKLIAVLLFAILVPSVLVTALGLVAVFQADTFVRDRFSKPLVGKVEEFHARLKQEWAKRLELFAAYLHDAHRRLPQLGELRGRDPWVKDLLLSTKGGLELVLDSPPLELWSPGGSPELKELNRLEVVEKNYPLSLLECRRLLEASRDDAVLVEAHLSAARLSYRLGEREEALRL